jgi:hypothetical protein
MPTLSGLGNRPQGIFEIKVHVVRSVLSLVFKTVFGMYLAHLVCLKSVKKEMSGSFQVPSQEIL